MKFITRGTWGWLNEETLYLDTWTHFTDNPLVYHDGKPTMMRDGKPWYQWDGRWWVAV